jgi:hypothetical protein
MKYIFTFTSIFTFTFASSLIAQNDERLFGEIKNACDSRSKQFHNVRFQVETTEFMEKGSLNRLTILFNKDEMPKYDTNPPKDLFLKGSFEYSINGNQFRHTRIDTMWISQIGETQECKRDDYFTNGKYYQTTLVPVLVNHQSAIIEKKAVSPILNRHELIALNLFCKLNSSEENPPHLNFNNYHIAQKNIILETGIVSQFAANTGRMSIRCI